MKLGVDFKDPATLRGLVWVVTALAGAVLLVVDGGQSIDKLLLLAAAVAGGLGVATKGP